MLEARKTMSLIVDAGITQEVPVSWPLQSGTFISSIFTDAMAVAELVYRPPVVTIMNCSLSSNQTRSYFGFCCGGPELGSGNCVEETVPLRMTPDFSCTRSALLVVAFWIFNRQPSRT